MIVAVALVTFLYRGFVPRDLEDGPVKVIDGDSLKRGEAEIRLYGIDAPEYRQTCKDASGGDYPCGRDAAEMLRQMIGGRDVSCRAVETDRYDRLVALCMAGQTVLNEEMVKRGWAVAYLQHSSRFAGLEAESRANRRGIWQGEFEMPENYRARNRGLVRGDVAGDD
jgi:endonuclease YncB( thermonuclease family)